MRLIRLLTAFACIAAGIAIGALNMNPVRLDIGFTLLSTTLGVVVIVALLIGVLLGGLVLAASVVWPLRRRLAQSERARATSDDARSG